MMLVDRQRKHVFRPFYHYTHAAVVYEVNSKSNVSKRLSYWLPGKNSPVGRVIGHDARIRMKVLSEVIEGGQGQEKSWTRVTLIVFQRFLNESLNMLLNVFSS